MRISRRTSGGKNFGQALEILEKNKHFSADVHDPKARTSMTPRGSKKLWSEKLRTESSFAILSKEVPWSFVRSHLGTLALKTEDFSKKSVVLVKRKNGFTKTTAWTENLGKTRAFSKSIFAFY